MNTHTPGPWSVWKFDEISLAVGPVEGGLAVAEVVNCNAHGIRTKETEERGEANASLIAAAPDLMEVLTKIVNQASGLHVDSCGQPMKKVRVALLDQARAALAKAEGKA